MVLLPTRTCEFERGPEDSGSLRYIRCLVGAGGFQLDEHHRCHLSQVLSAIADWRGSVKHQGLSGRGH